MHEFNRRVRPLRIQLWNNSAPYSLQPSLGVGEPPINMGGRIYGSQCINLRIQSHDLIIQV